MTKIYTKRGDAGYTSIFGGGKVSKTDIHIDVLGCIDELNAHLGFAHSILEANLLGGIIFTIQNMLFEIGAEIATPPDKRTSRTCILESDVEFLENAIDDLELQLDPLKNFIIPGGSRISSILHISRAVCRRTERRAVELIQHDLNQSVMIVKYLNRLSDLLFVMARYANKINSTEDVHWKSRTGA